MKGKVIILATGGTIAGVGEEGKIVGYKSGTIKVDDLIAAMPKLKDVAEIEAVQICNINSDDITDTIWIKLANTINEYAKDPSVVGFVITHGTDTMEETAYFLNLTVKTEKPVVFTGSMRPATSISADGYMNLYEAVCVASSDEAKGKGVLVVFSDCIFAARTVTKTSTYNVTAISSEKMSIPVVVCSRIDGGIIFKENLLCKNTIAADNLSPQKAAVLLRLILACKVGREKCKKYL